jgi:hypothetical protein
VATKSAQPEPVKAEVIEEALDALDTALDRVKVLYEQYFLGIQKQPPTYLHTDIERKLRDIAQLQIRNTAMRYRFATLQQKFGSYNSYWRRTLRQIENGTYTRNLFKVGRQAARTGADVPPEILAAMPKRMRDQVMRDREAALALARLREKPVTDDIELLTLADEDVDIDVEDLDLDAAVIEEPSELRRNALTTGAYRIDESDADFDLDAFFAAVTNEDGPDLELHPPGAARRRSTGGIPVVGRAPTLRSESRPPADSQPGGHPRPGTLSGSPIAALSEDLRLPGGRTRRSGRTGAGRRSTSQIPTDRGNAARANPAANAGARSSEAAEPVTEVTGTPRRSGKSKPPIKHASTQGLPRVPRAPAAATPVPPPEPPRSAAPEPPRPALPASQATRSIPVSPGTPAPPGPPQATRSIPVAASPPPPQATRSIPVAPPPSPQATRSIPVAPGVIASSQATRSSPVASGSGRDPSQVRPIPPPGSAADPSQGTRSIPSPGSAATPLQGTRSMPAPGAAADPSQGTRASPGPGSAAEPSPGTRSIPAPGLGAAPSQAPRSIPVAPGATAASSQAPRSIPVAPGAAAASSQATRSIPVAPAPSQATRSIPIVPGSAAAQTPAPVESMAGPFPRIPSIPSLPKLGGSKPAPAPPQPASSKERGALPLLIPRSTEPAEAESDDPTDVMSAAVPERMPEPPAPAARAPSPERPAPTANAAPVRAATERPPATPRPAESEHRSPPRPAEPERAATTGAPQRPTPPRERPIPPSERRQPEPPQAPPPGMSNADVNALYAKYVKAKEILGEEAGPGAYGKLLKTINAQAPKIMEQYNAKGVDFSVVVKDNQVIIRAKPKP